MNLNKESNILNFPSEKIYKHISNINNFEEILGDDIKDFNVIDKEFFTIKIGSLPTINLKLELFENQKQVKLVSTNPKIIFYFKLSIEKIDDKKSKIKMNFTGKFSSMMEMMIKSPINKFADEIINKIDKIDFN